jgi:hypothetical protein
MEAKSIATDLFVQRSRGLSEGEPAATLVGDESITGTSRMPSRTHRPENGPAHAVKLSLFSRVLHDVRYCAKDCKESAETIRLGWSMKEEVRRAVAYAAAVYMRGSAPSTILRHERERYARMTPTCDHPGTHISHNSAWYYHYGTGSHISVRFEGLNFSGYDYESGHRYTGHITANEVQLYDYAEGRYFTYAL